MKPLAIADVPTFVLGLQDEIRRSEESGYDHRLHGVLLMVQGMSCPGVSRLLRARSERWSIGFVDLKAKAGLAWWKESVPVAPAAEP